MCTTWMRVTKITIHKFNMKTIKGFYAPGSNDRGKIVFVLSVCLLSTLTCFFLFNMSSNFLLDKGRVAENLQKECLCYFIISSTSLWRNQFNHINMFRYNF